VRGTLRSLQDPNDGTKSLATIDVDAYDAILVVGGQAPMFAFDSASTLHTKFVEFSG
jgi:putative intracellular protease/amidase